MINHARLEKQKAEIVSFIERETSNCVMLNDPDSSPANAARQLGRGYVTRDFEERLLLLNPNFIFTPHPTNPTKRCLYFTDRRGKRFICAYESGFLPEHSIFSVKRKEVWDGVTTHINKKDLPKHEVTPTGVVWGGMTPGFKKVDIPWNEVTRGWRTVLVKIVGERIATPTQVESLFGSANRAEWAKHMGRSNQKTVL